MIPVNMVLLIEKLNLEEFMMKKLLALLLMVVMSVTLLAGCGTDPVQADFENYLNYEMTDVNANYSKLTEEVGKWESYGDDAELVTSINQVLLPLVDGSLEALADINPATEEIKAVKEKYVKVMDAYKEAFELLAEGCETQEDATINAGAQKLEEAVDLLDAYNKALEEIAAQFDMEIEY